MATRSVEAYGKVIWWAFGGSPFLVDTVTGIPVTLPAFTTGDTVDMTFKIGPYQPLVTNPGAPYNTGGMTGIFWDFFYKGVGGTEWTYLGGSSGGFSSQATLSYGNKTNVYGIKIVLTTTNIVGDLSSPYVSTFTYYEGGFTSDFDADVFVPIYANGVLDSIPTPSGEITGTVADSGSSNPTLSVDYGGVNYPQYKVVKTPIDHNIPDPAAPPGSGYKVVIEKPDGTPVAVGYLPIGASPNMTLRVDGRIITVLSNGAVVCTYVIPEAQYSFNSSTFWTGYVNASTGVQGSPITPTRPPLAGFQYQIDTSFVERPLGFKPRLWLYACNRYSEGIWEDENGIQASRLPDDSVIHSAYWAVADGHTALIPYALALRIYDAGLSRFLAPVP